MIVDSGAKIVENVGSNPGPHLPMFHDAGITVLHKCTIVRHAVKAQDLGVDSISIDGFEYGVVAARYQDRTGQS